MTSTSHRHPFFLPALLALAMTACGNAPRDAAGDADANADAGPTPLADDTDRPGDALAQDVDADVRDAAAGADAEGTAGFDPTTLPMSTALGDFPYFSLPDGYRESPRSTKRLDFGQVAFWTGEGFETIDGRVYATGIRTERDSGKQFSAIEVARNFEHVLTSAGAVQVFSGTLPNEARRDETARTTMRAYGTEATCRAHDQHEVYVLRRADGLTWVRSCSSQHFAGLIVVDAQAFVPTSALLPASALKQQLDADGRVAIQLNFAVDKADILPESQPQLEQVLALLSQDAALRLSVEGHTDDTGTAARNRTLSEARAQAVVAALTGQGVDSARLSAAGYGQDRPVADNDSDEGRAKNRRVELVKR